MIDTLNIEFIDRKEQLSEYDWANISLGEERVGKARCLIKGKTLVIYSINIYPEYQGRHFGAEFVERAKQSYEILIADRVRYNAIGFWEKMGFEKYDKDNYIYRSNSRPK